MPRVHGFLPYMEHGLQSIGICRIVSSLWFHAVNPAFGCVAPHIEMVCVPTIAAMCMLLESMDIMSVSLLMSRSSSVRLFSLPATAVTLSRSHVFSVCASCPGEPKSSIWFPESASVLTTWRISGVGYIFP